MTPGGQFRSRSRDQLNRPVVCDSDSVPDNCNNFQVGSLGQQRKRLSWFSDLFQSGGELLVRGPAICRLLFLTMMTSAAGERGGTSQETVECIVAAS